MANAAGGRERSVAWTRSRPASDRARTQSEPRGLRRTRPGKYSCLPYEASGWVELLALRASGRTNKSGRGHQRCETAVRASLIAHPKAYRFGVGLPTERRIQTREHSRAVGTADTNAPGSSRTERMTSAPSSANYRQPRSSDDTPPSAEASTPPSRAARTGAGSGNPHRTLPRQGRPRRAQAPRSRGADLLGDPAKLTKRDSRHLEIVRRRDQHPSLPASGRWLRQCQNSSVRHPHPGAMQLKLSPDRDRPDHQVAAHGR